jgi:PAS domain S-box-containing protein
VTLVYIKVSGEYGTMVTRAKSRAKGKRESQTIGEVVKSLRTSSGMTSEQLAVSAGLSPSYIRKLESGARHAVTLDTAKKLANGLGVLPDVFFQADTPKGSASMSVDAVPQLANQLQQWTSSVQNGMAALVEEYERMRVLADATSEAIVVMDKGTVLFVNRALMDLLGLDADPEEMVGFNAMDLENLGRYIAPESVIEAHNRLSTMADDPSAFNLLHADGSRVTVWLTPKVVEYCGRPVIAAVLRDVPPSDMIVAATEDSIDWEAAWTEMLAEGLVKTENPETVAVLIHSMAKILWANERAATLLRVKDLKDFVGQKPLSFVSPGSLTTVLQIMADMDEGLVTLDLLRTDGTTFPVQILWNTVSYRRAIVRVSQIIEIGTRM